MARRHGGLNIVPPFAEKGVRIYSGRVEALGSILSYLENQKEKYVVMSDANIAINYDFNALLAAHQASGADVTVAYQKTEIPEGRKNDNYTLTVDADGRVTELLFNDYRSGVQNLDLNIYVLERETLIKLVKDATSRGLIYFERDILAHNVNILNIRALEYTGYVAHVCDMKSYFDENLKLIDEKNLNALFPKESPVYTKIRDDNPVRYVNGSSVSNSLLADGCVIEGTVENCVLFRGVRVKKGAVVRNCVLMQDTVVEPGAQLDCVVTDKNVRVTARRSSPVPRASRSMFRRTTPSEPDTLKLSQGRLPSPVAPLKEGRGPLRPRPLFAYPPFFLERRNTMKILYAASEATPFAKSGGLADVAGSLPKALVKDGVDARVIMPLYGDLKMRDKLEYVTNYSVPVGWRSQYCGLFKAEVNGVTYYFLDNEYYFKRRGLYGFYDDGERFAFFSRAVLETLFYIDFTPDIINCNDWQTALVPVYLNLYYRHLDKFNRIKTIFTIHNIAYQASTAPISWRIPAASATVTSTLWNTMAAPTL